MGKWLPGRVQRIGRDGEVDLILDDGTELENVPEERLRMPKQQAMKRASSWDCLESLARDNHLRRGKVGKEPKITTTMKRDEVRGIEELLGQELVKGLRDAFGDADSMKEGELDIDDVLTAFTTLRRVASRKDILAWLRTRSSRVRTRRSFSFVEFVKCFAGAISVSRGAAAPSRHRCDSCPSHDAGGGFFFEFEAVRTESSDVDRITSKSPQNPKRNDPPPPF